MTTSPEIKKIDKQIEELQSKKAELNHSAWNWDKFVRGLSLWIPKSLGKFLSTVFHNLVIAVIVAAILFGIGFWKGSSSKPILVNAKDRIIMITDKSGNNHTIEFAKGKMLFDGKYVTKGDIKSLKPYGIHFRPKMFFGVGNEGAAIGAGAEVAYLWRLNLDLFGMSDKTIYTGVSYDINSNEHAFLGNSAIGLALGKSLENAADTRIMLYFTIKF